MANSKTPITRRQLIKLSLAGLAAIPLTRLFTGKAVNAQAARVEESDELAQELSYRHDATEVDNPQREAGQFCRTCQFFQGDPDTEWGPCTVFGGRQVNSGGWCTSWFKRAG